MKAILMIVAFISATALQAQSNKNLAKASFQVNGNCGMCKTTIEKAAKKAGAIAPIWSEETHQLNFSYNTKKTTEAKVQKAIANVGYDNAGATAPDAAYDKLHGCCKYERKPMQAEKTTSIKACCKAKLEKGETACCMPETAKMHDCCKKNVAAGKEACCKQ